MDVQVRVDLDDDVPVVVKSATGAAVDRLRHERERLERAVHPGVVALAGAPGDQTELRTCYAGEPVTRWLGTLARIAGLGAAVASTLADLHDLGVVHGRVDATHILIGDDGRPRLCGLSHPGDAAPADDVAALGTVLSELADRASADRRGPFRRPRTPRGDRRALRQVVERATDPVATRRPSARALAAAILTAVPTASLPTRPGTRTVTGPAPGAVAAAGATTNARSRPAEPDTLDRIWAVADQQTDDERWAAAFGEGPPDLPLGGHGGDGNDESRGGDGPGAADGPAADGSDRDGGDREGDGSDVRLPMAEIDTPAWFATTRGDDHAGRGAPDEPWLHDLAARSDGGRAAVADTATAPNAGADRRPPSRDLGDDLTREQSVAAGRFAPTPRSPIADPESGPPARKRRLAALGAGGALATAIAVAGAVVIGSGGGADTPRSEPRAAVECPPAARPAADVDGDGCPEPLIVHGSTVDAGVAQWSLGEPGDLVAVGDWDCDGNASAALLRPATGDVFVFSAWAELDEPVTVRSSQRVAGGVGIRAAAGEQGCDLLLVDRAAGGAATVEVPR